MLLRPPAAGDAVLLRETESVGSCRGLQPPEERMPPDSPDGSGHLRREDEGVSYRLANSETKNINLEE